jgi:hypothetical protein
MVSSCCGAAGRCYCVVQGDGVTTEVTGTGGADNPFVVTAMGGGGGEMRSFYYPTDPAFGAVGDGVTDDQAALEACWEAAGTDGGVVLIDRPYAFSDKIKHYGGMEVWQITPRRMPFVAGGTGLGDYPIEPGLIAIEDTAWYQYGDGSDGSGSLNDNPGPIRGLAIDGRGIAGGGDGLFVMDANQSSIYDLMVVYSAGTGLITGRSQNCNFYNPQIGGNLGTGFKIKTLAGLDTQQGAGHIIVFGGHIHDNYLGVEIDMGAGTFFPPHDNVFNTTLIESGRLADLGPVKCAVDAKAGQTQFNDVNITFGVNATAHEEDCCILMDNPTTTGLGSVSTIVGFDGGSIGGGGDGMTDAIRIKQTLSANELRLSGRIAWANVDYMICEDGINGGFADAIITHTGTDVFITGGIEKFRAINGGTLLNSYRKAFIGTTYEMPTGQIAGVDIINGNTPNPFAVKHADESVSRRITDWNGTDKWLKTVTPTSPNPAPIGTTLGTTVVAGDIWGVTGRWGIGGGFYRTCVLKSIAVNQAVNLDWSTANYILLSFSAGASATSITFTPAVTIAGGAIADWVPSRGQHLLVGISAVASGSTITWPSNITFVTTAPQPVNGVLQFIEFVYDTGSSKWFEKSRSHQTASGTGDVSGPGVAVADDFATFNGTTGKFIKDSGWSRDTDGTLAANSDSKIPTQRAVKTYADTGLALKAPTASPTFTGNPVAPTQAAGDNSTKIATTAFVDLEVAALDAMIFKGPIDCSTNPNFPAADRGHTYRVSVAGKIGGASGFDVKVNTVLICLTDGTASGTYAAVGSSWLILEKSQPWIEITGGGAVPASTPAGTYVYRY